MWSMADVVCIAGAIAYFLAAIPADVQIRGGAWCYLMVAILSFVGDRSLDRREVWNAIMPDSTAIPTGPVVSCSVCEMVVPSEKPGEPCPRCGGTLDRDVIRRFAPALAAVGAAIPLSLPAYSFAIIV